MKKKTITEAYNYFHMNTDNYRSIHIMNTIIVEIEYFNENSTLNVYANLNKFSYTKEINEKNNLLY